MRDRGFETLRSAAIFWIVFAHVGGISPGAGLGYSETYTMRYLLHTISFFPVPMFMLLAGYFYARKPVMASDVTLFCKRKFTTIMLPAFGVGILMLLLKAIAYKQLSSLSIIQAIDFLLYPSTHLWFLYALFWCFVCTAVLDARKLLGKAPYWLAITLAIAVFDLAVQVPSTLLALNKLPYVLPFFLLGYGLKHYTDVFWPKNAHTKLLLVAVFLLAVNQWVWFATATENEAYLTALSRAMSWTVLPLLLFYRPTINLLATLGPLTFIIYLFHPFGAAAARILLLNFTSIESPIILFSICYTVGVASSIALYWAGAAIIGSISASSKKRINNNADERKLGTKSY